MHLILCTVSFDISLLRKTYEIEILSPVLWTPSWFGKHCRGRNEWGGLFSDNMFLDDGEIAFWGGKTFIASEDIIAERRNVGPSFTVGNDRTREILTYKIFSKEFLFQCPSYSKGKEETRTRTSGSLCSFSTFKGSVQSLWCRPAPPEEGHQWPLKAPGLTPNTHFQWSQFGHTDVPAEDPCDDPVRR